MNEIIINEDKVKGHLTKCVECNINFTSSPNHICVLCEARIKGDKKALAKWKEIFEMRL